MTALDRPAPIASDEPAVLPSDLGSLGTKQGCTVTLHQPTCPVGQTFTHCELWFQCWKPATYTTVGGHSSNRVVEG